MELVRSTAGIRRHPARVAAVVLVIYWVMAVSASVHFSAAGDEIAHIAGGLAYWRFGENQLQPENGNFPKRWATLPLAVMGVPWPEVNGPLLQSATINVLGYKLFYQTGNRPAILLFAARAMIALLGAALGALIWWWTRRLWNETAALFAVTLFALSPTMLAQGALATSDMAVSLLLLVTVTAYWRLLERITTSRLIACGAALGVLFLTKMSCVLVLPMMAVLGGIRSLTGGSLTWEIRRSRIIGSRIGKATAIASATLLAGMFAWVIIWGAFGFHFVMFTGRFKPEVTLVTPWSALKNSGDWTTRVIASACHYRLLPESWLYGLAFTLDSLHGRPAFLNGIFGRHGWSWYFPYAVLVKTPLPLLALVVMGGITAFRRGLETRKNGEPPSFWYAASPLAVLFVVYWAFAITSHTDIGQRHVLPTYAPMFILAGGALGWSRGRSSTVRLCLVGVLTVWLAVESWRIRPYYLEYFNQVAGGPSEGYRHLVDSNLDWGQDLPALKEWLEAHASAQRQPLYLAYFGPGDPDAYGIHGMHLLNLGFTPTPIAVPSRLTGGLYCISATFFSGVYTKAPLPWNQDYEALYQELRRRREKAPLPLDAGIDFLHLRFRRLCHYLATRKPDAMAGYSILIFHLTDEQVAQALSEPLTQAAGSHS